jgi:hypothetical protein
MAMHGDVTQEDFKQIAVAIPVQSDLVQRFTPKLTSYYKASGDKSGTNRCNISFGPANFPEYGGMNFTQAGMSKQKKLSGVYRHFGHPWLSGCMGRVNLHISTPQRSIQFQGEHRGTGRYPLSEPWRRSAVLSRKSRAIIPHPVMAATKRKTSSPAPCGRGLSRRVASRYKT